MIRPEDAYRPAAVPDDMLSALGRGINIQGWSLWSEPAFSLAEMQRLKADGFEHVRVYFDARASDANRADYPADLGKDWLIAKADQTIANALSAGLKVVINPTPEIDAGDTQAEIDAHIDALGAFAAHIAKKFGTDGVVIETTNEPSFPSQAAWAEIEARLIAAVRAAAPDMTIMTAANLISDGGWSQLGGLEDSVAHRDDNLVYSVHSYYPSVFTSQQGGVSHWLGTPELVASVTGGIAGWYYRDAVSTEAALAATVDAFARTADAMGVPLHIGEFGAAASAPEASRLAYLAAVSEAFEKHGLGWSVWQSHGEFGIYERTSAGLQPIDPALRAALGLAGERPDAPLTVTFAAGSTHDLWAPWAGTALQPSPGTSVTLGQAELGAAGASGASVWLARDGVGALSISSLGPWLSVRDLGIEDDDPGTITATGFERSWISLGNGGASTVTVETMHHRIFTGNGADSITLTAWSPGTANLGGSGYVSSGAGDDVITIDARPTAANTGGVTAGFEVWAGAGDDRITIKSGVNGMFSGGSGDDRIVSGAGNEDLRGDAGIDTVVLPGLRSAWTFTPGTDAVGAYIEAAGPGGTDKLRGFEWVSFGDGSVARFGELSGNRAPEHLKLLTTGVAEGEVAKASATDPEGGTLTWFLSDTAGQRFAIDPYSGIVTLRPGAVAQPGESYLLGLGVVDAAGSVSGTMLPVTIPPSLAPSSGGAGSGIAASIVLSNGMGADGLTQLRSPAWSGQIATDSTRTLTGNQLALPGVAADARVSLAADASGTTTIAVLSAWNSLKNVHVRDTDGGRLVVHNAVSVDVDATGAHPFSLTITDAKRGIIATGSGNDVIAVSAVANTSDGALFRIDAGAGNDVIMLSSSSGWTRAVIDGGAGDDIIASGPGNDEIRGGDGVDTLLLSGLRATTSFTAGTDGAGRFIRAVGPGGTDILRGIEFVTFSDGARYRAGELIGKAAPTAITLAAGAGVLAVARATDADDSTGFVWAIKDAAASPLRIDAVTGAITAKPGVTVAKDALHTLDLVVTDPWGNVFEAPVTLHTEPPHAKVTLSNAMATSIAQLTAGSWAGEAGAERQLTIAELSGLAGVQADARVRVVEGADGITEVAVLSAWNSVKNVLVEDPNGGTVSIDNAVHAWFVGGDAAATVIVTDTKRATVTTGAGDDTVTIEALSNGGGEGNLMRVATGGGDDRVTVTGHGSMTTAHLIGGAGDDVLLFAGGGGTVLDGGAGADTMRGGSGRDQLILRPGEVQGDIIEGFGGAAAAGGDWLAMMGFGAGASLTHQGGGLWRVNYVSGGVAKAETFTVVGVTALGADDVLWG